MDARWWGTFRMMLGHRALEVLVGLRQGPVRGCASPNATASPMLGEAGVPVVAMAQPGAAGVREG